MRDIYGLIFLIQLAHGWVWQCNSTSGYCNRLRETLESESYFHSQSSCRLVCGDDGIVWPKPKTYNSTAKDLVKIDHSQINFSIKSGTNGQAFLQKTTKYFLKALHKDHQIKTVCEGPRYALNISANIVSDDVTLNWDTIEEYSLKIQTNDAENTVTAVITSMTVYGARHAIETLLQLLVSFDVNETTCLATIQEAFVFDSPTYRHRGLLLDTARNFLSVNVIKKNIVAMAASKLNFLHWHITDTQSFPFESTRLPNMTLYGAYSEREVYTPDDIKSIKNFAIERGVRVVLEIDAPAHAGNGWQWANEAGLGNLSVCINKQPWRSYCIQPPCGQLNPANPNVYKALNSLYQDIVDLFPESDAFHMGGDEVKVECWNSTQEIIDYIGKNNRTSEAFLGLWAEFQNKSATAYDVAAGNNDTKFILWTSDLTDPSGINKFLPTDRYIIQSWELKESVIPSELVNLGYRIIISTKDKWYLDHGFWGTTTYSKWTDVYDNTILTGDLVLGGEVCMWGELVDDSNVLSRTWPRAAAAAERLWSNPSTTAQLAKDRFYLQIDRLRKRGVSASPATPKYCVQNEELCSNYL